MPLSWAAFASFITLAALLASPQHQAVNHGFVGAATCAGCHKEIAAAQSQTSMARTWQGVTPAGLPLDFDERKTEGPIGYQLRRVGDRFLWRMELPGRFSREASVEAVVGGRRQGLRFPAQITD